jgi:type II secretory pathway component GspD/PulD (secretin)
MKNHGLFAPSLVLLALVLAHPAHAQPSPAPRAAEAAREESFVTEKGFASRVFEVRHREPSDLAAVLRPLGSGYRGATVSANRDFKTISVRDFPENIAAIEAALKRLDVAEAPRKDVELRLWVLVASNEEAAAGRFPEDLKEAVAALKTTLTYRSYSLASSFVQRVRDGAREIQGQGVTDLAPVPSAGEVQKKAAGKAMQLEYRISSLSLGPGENGSVTVKLDGFWLTLVGDGRAQLKTDVTLRDGEKVVVGTSTVQDKGLVVVISARVIR